ncbi:MAG: M48 family metalloprotease [Pseudomonadota bacterium]
MLGTTPDLGGASRQAELERLGRAVLRTLVQRSETLDDAVTTSYLVDLVNRLRGANAITTGVQSITVFRNPTVNAFVLPGGLIGVNAGLILEAPSESALASVLAHELAHLTQRHVERVFARQSRSGLATLAALLAGALVVRDNPQAAQAAVYSGLAASVQQQLDYSRQNEREADRIGQKFLENAGFRSAGMAEMLQHLSALSGLNARGGIEYLQTHPLTPNRVGEAWERARRQPDTGNAPQPGFALVKQRVAHLLDQHLADSPTADYGAALSQLETDPEASLVHLDRLPEPWREARYSRLLRARALLGAGRTDAADTLFAELERDYPFDYLTHHVKASEHARQGDYARASAVLSRWLRTHPAPNASMLRRTAQYHRAAGDLAESQRWYGEYYAMRGDLERAAAHFSEALKTAEEGSNRHARLSSRLADVTAEINADNAARPGG